MSQAVLEFTPASEIFRDVRTFSNKENPIFEVIEQFKTEPRYRAFIRDLQELLPEYGESLCDSELLRISAETLDLFIQDLVKVKQDIAERSHSIIERHVEQGSFEDDLFELEPITKKEPRKVNVCLLKKTYPDKWKTLVDIKVAAFEENYTPTQADIKPLFGKGWDALLTEAKEVVIGYRVVPKVSKMPERAGTVEL